MDCDSLFELGPPPDMLSIPPPPIPHLIDDFMNRLTVDGLNHKVNSLTPFEYRTDEKLCNLCHWAAGNGVGYIGLAQKGAIIDDTWFLIIITSCVGASLLGIILAIAYFKYREGKLQPLSDMVLAKKEKALGLERCEAVLYPSPTLQDTNTSRALWAGLKKLEGNHYTVDNCQPMTQKPAKVDLIPTSDSLYDYADYSSLGFTNLPPAYGYHISNTQKPEFISVPHGSPNKSFENVGYNPSDDVIRTVMPDGSVVSRAASLLGVKNGRSNSQAYLYEQPKLKNFHLIRYKSLERGRNGIPPIISEPTRIPAAAFLPPLNSRYSGRYTLTAFANGSHTLAPCIQNVAKDNPRLHVSLDRCGNPNTTIAPISPTDHIYASPITSPVI